jgi:hypothetical protein
VAVLVERDAAVDRDIDSGVDIPVELAGETAVVYYGSGV